MPHPVELLDGPTQEALRRFKADIFQALAHPTRIAIVEQLREGELPAGAFTERLGLEPANISQHLGVLRAKRIVGSRKDRNQVYYWVRDPALIDVLDTMRRYFHSQLNEANAMLREIELEEASAK